MSNNKQYSIVVNEVQRREILDGLRRIPPNQRTSEQELLIGMFMSLPQYEKGAESPIHDFTS